MKRRLIYFLLTITCFLLCVLIVKLFSNHQVVRGFVGDIIVTILIYAFVKIFIDITPVKLSIFVLLFSYSIEILQYFRFIEFIGLSENKLARVMFGATFDYTDLIAYTIGVIIIYLMDTYLIIGRIHK